MSRYELLHYPGDITARVRTGQILGCDEFGRPYEVIDADYQHGQTVVHLQYATAENLRAAGWVTA